MAKKEMIKLAKHLYDLEMAIDNGSPEEAATARQEMENLIKRIVEMYGFKGMFEVDEYICTHFTS